jgi:hypothetical protein
MRKTRCVRGIAPTAAPVQITCKRQNRMLTDITEKNIHRLKPGAHRDKRLKGFMIVVGKHRKTFRFQWDEYHRGGDDG